MPRRHFYCFKVCVSALNCGRVSQGPILRSPVLAVSSKALLRLVVRAYCCHQTSTRPQHLEEPTQSWQAIGFATPGDVLFLGRGEGEGRARGRIGRRKTARAYLNIPCLPRGLLWLPWHLKEAAVAIFATAVPTGVMVFGLQKGF